MGLILGIGATKRSTNGSESSCAPTFKESARISTYQGIDVSHHQGSIDWSKVATDTQIQFVYLKATEGATHIDKMYEYNLKKARSVGFRVGSYHYLRKTSGMYQQFMNFTKTAPKDQQDLIPMVDVEEEIAKDSIRLFCQLLTEYYGKRPAIYGTNRSYNKFCAPEFNDYILMIGRYGTNPPIISGTSHYDIWQYSETGVIPGIPKPVDLDRIHPDFDLSNLLME
jgi:lysozyme